MFRIFIIIHLLLFISFIIFMISPLYFNNYLAEYFNDFSLSKLEIYRNLNP
jgi:hypothetical protein